MSQPFDDIHQSVRDRYSKAATGGCGCSPSPCCGGDVSQDSRVLGYSTEELAALPDGADLGLGCGNPTAIAALSPGEVVLDLGAGAGIDAFLAAARVGPTGRVIGVDMTPEMVSRARSNAVDVGATNVDFRLGELEHLPVADDTVDVILSNCVINLVPDKRAAWAEALRVLKPGGRLAISDIVALEELPPAIKADVDLYTGCVSGATELGLLEQMLTDAGFVDIRVDVKEQASAAFIRDWAPGLEGWVASATIEAVKPGV